MVRNFDIFLFNTSDITNELTYHFGFISFFIIDRLKTFIKVSTLVYQKLKKKKRTFHILDSLNKMEYCVIKFFTKHIIFKTYWPKQVILKYFRYMTYYYSMF